MTTDYAWLLRQWCNGGMITGTERPLLVRDLVAVADHLDGVQRSAEYRAAKRQRDLTERSGQPGGRSWPDTALRGRQAQPSQSVPGLVTFTTLRTRGDA